MSAQKLITDHLDLWTGAVTHKISRGRGSNGKIELTGIKKLRELILELAVRGKLVEQDPSDEPASVLLERIAEEKARLVKEGKIKKAKPLSEVSEDRKPFNLPAGWEWVRLGSISDIDRGGSPRPIKSFLTSSADGYSWIKIGDTDQGGKYITSTSERITKEGLPKTRLVHPGDFLLTNSMSFGRPYITKIKGCIHDGWLKISPPQDINRDYLYHLLSSSYVKEFFTAYAAGAVVQNLNSAKVRELPTPIPPVSEQQRIVEKVDELMALCDRLEQQIGDQLEAHEVLVDTLLDALTRSADASEVAENWARIAEHFDTLFTTEASIDKLKQTILQLAVMGQLVEQDPNDEPASELLERIAEEKARLVKEGNARKQKPLPEIAYDEYPFEKPAGWVISRMDDITDIQSGIAKGKKLLGKKATWLPYLRVANVQRGMLDLSEVKEIEIACDEAEKYSVKKRDLLITEGGDWDKVGRTAIWNAEIDPMAHQNHVFRARLILGEQNEKWIEKYLNSGFARDYFANSSKQTTNLASINKTQLRSCTVPVPPLEEQQRIIEKVDELMALCDQLKTRLSEAGETRTHLAEAVVEQAVN